MQLTLFREKDLHGDNTGIEEVNLLLNRICALRDNRMISVEIVYWAYH